MKHLTVLAALAIAAATSGFAYSSGPAPRTRITASPTPPTPAGTIATTATAGVQITSRSVSRFGQILVNAQGRTLYIFVPDRRSKVTCLGECAEIWPPAFLGAGQRPRAAGKVKQSLLGSDPDPSVGEPVITYDHWPLYTYIGDAGPGSTSGQDLNLNGGLWYLISPSGSVIKGKP